MAIPRSTLVTGAIALVSTSALIVVLLKQQATPPINPLKYPVAKEEAPPYTPAQPGALNPIAAKVLAEGGPRTPTVTTVGGLRRGVVRFRLAMDGTENLEVCLRQVFGKAVLLEGEESAEVLTCQGTGSRVLEAQLVLTAMPLVYMETRNEPPGNARCGVRWSGTLGGGAGEKRSLTTYLVPTVGALDGVCRWRESEAISAMLGEVDKVLGAPVSP